MNTDPYGYQRRTHMMPPPLPRRELVDPAYSTRALVAPSAAQTHVVPNVNTVVKTHPKGLVLSVPMCCDKCVEKVRKALQDLEGVRDIVLDQYHQLVTIQGDVDPEKALRRVRRVKKRSKFWKMATQPLQYSGSPATGQVLSTKPLVSAYRAPGYNTSAFRAPGYHTSAYRAPAAGYSRYASPPRYNSSYSRAYSSPYIDSAYRSGYVEPRGVGYGRFSHDDLEYHSRFDRGTPFVQMADDLFY